MRKVGKVEQPEHWRLDEEEEIFLGSLGENGMRSVPGYEKKNKLEK